MYHVFSPFAFFANYPLTSKRSHPKAQRRRHIKYFLCLTSVRNCFPVVVGCSVILCCALLDKVLTSQQKHLGDTWGFWCPVTMFVWLMGVVRMISTLAAYSLFFIFAEFWFSPGNVKFILDITFSFFLHCITCFIWSRHTEALMMDLSRRTRACALTFPHAALSICNPQILYISFEGSICINDFAPCQFLTADSGDCWAVWLQPCGFSPDRGQTLVWQSDLQSGDSFPADQITRDWFWAYAWMEVISLA